MSRSAFVNSKPIALAPPAPPRPCSLEAKLAAARRMVFDIACLPRWSPERQRAQAAALTGSADFEAGRPITDNPYQSGTTEAAAWLLGWWTRSREDA